jgi:hypothetical protein
VILAPVVLAEVHRGPVGVGRRVVEQRLVDRPCLDPVPCLELLPPLGKAQRPARGFLEQGLGDGARAVELQEAVVERAVEGPLQPDEQLHALEAPEPHLALERRVGGHGAERPAAPGLAGEVADDVEDAGEHLVEARARRLHGRFRHPRTLAGRPGPGKLLTDGVAAGKLRGC